MDEGSLGRYRDSGIKPGFIKIALSNTNGRITPIQQTILKAALLTSKETGLHIQAHTVGGETIMHALEILIVKILIPATLSGCMQTLNQTSHITKAALAGMWIEVDLHRLPALQ